MSPTDSHGYTPPPRSSRIAVEDVKSLLEVFLKVSNGTTIKWCIYAAGIAACLDILRTLGIAMIYIAKHLS